MAQGTKADEGTKGKKDLLIILNPPRTIGKQSGELRISRRQNFPSTISPNFVKRYQPLSKISPQGIPIIGPL